MSKHKHHRHSRRITPLKIVGLFAGIALIIGVIYFANGLDKTTYYRAPSFYNDEEIEMVRTVYVCNNKESKVYHRFTNCAVLENCTDAIKEVMLRDAEASGKRECSKCRE
jgi:hypothetical protein